ncbi:MAG TPA: permease prefix domain 2-containing transporter [Candidatus Sulfotelmatobacter sp.]|nr:permease prefix domain 2-containing transporter [Candidatus Sulfotelmatobacter sp.]
MTTKAHSVQPPRIATWLVNLFATEDESMVGDLHEEFAQVGSRSGIGVARNWYWRQSLKTIADLVGGGFRSAPWSTLGATTTGFLLLRAAHWLPDKLLNVVTERYLMYWSNHFQAYLWLLNALFPAFLLTSLFTGCVVALIAKKREMIATMALGIVLCAMILFGYLSALAQTGDFNFLWNMPWAFSDPIAIILGGMVVRQFRLHAANLSVAKNEE